MKAACWVMERFGVAPALIGDILEGAARHSIVWSSAQVLGATLRTVSNDLRQHPVLAMRAIVAGWALYFLSARVQPHYSLLNPGMNHLWLAARVLITFRAEVAFGMVTADAMIGFAVSRCHRPYGMAAAFSFVMTLLCLYSWSALDEIPRSLHISPYNPFAPFVVPDVLFLSAVVFVFVPLAVMAGAALGAGRPRSRA